MKKIAILLKFYLALLISGFIIYSCCGEISEVLIVDGDELWFSLQEQTSGSVRADTISGPFRMHARYELLFVENFLGKGLITAAYGLSCEEDFQNAFIESSLTLACDQDIEYDGMTIPAGSDMMAIAELVPIIGQEDITISFPPEALSKIRFRNGPNTFTLGIETTDDLELECVGEVALDL